MEKINYIVKTVSGCVDSSFPLTEFHSDSMIVQRNKFDNQKQFIASEVPEDAEGIRTIVSDQEKFLLTMEPSMYHTIVDSIGSTLYWIKRHPDALFLIDMYFIYENYHRWHVMHGLFIDILDKSGVDYRLVNLYKDSLILDNFHIVTDQDYFPNERLKLVNSFIKDNYISNPDIEPTRKLYISRKRTRTYFLWDDQELKPGSPYQNDRRIYDEEQLEDYFAALGYEILYAEQFSDVREQIELFYSAKSIISASGSGLTNSIFMQPGSNVLEITTPIGAIFPDGFHYSITDAVKASPADWLFEYHHIYKEISNALGHNYMSIQTDKDQRTVTKFLDDRPYLKDMLKNHW